MRILRDRRVMFCPGTFYCELALECAGNVSVIRVYRDNRVEFEHNNSMVTALPDCKATQFLLLADKMCRADMLAYLPVRHTEKGFALYWKIKARIERLGEFKA